MEVDPPTYTLALVSPGPNRLELLRLIRELRPELGPAQAKALVDGGRCVVLREVGHFELDRIRRKFERTGADIEVARND